MTNLIDVTADYLKVNDGNTFDTGARYVETTTGTPDFVTIEGPSTDQAWDLTYGTVAWIWKVGAATEKSLRQDSGQVLAATPATTFNTTTNIKLTD